MSFRDGESLSLQPMGKKFHLTREKTGTDNERLP